MVLRLLVHTSISWLECLASYIGDDATSTSLESMLCVLHSELEERFEEASATRTSNNCQSSFELCPEVGYEHAGSC